MRRLTLTVTPEQAGRTVKSLLRRELHMADGAIARVKTVPDGICLNGVHACTVDRVAAGDVLTVRIDDKRSGGKFTPVAVPLDILYEDADLLALNKPAGMAVHGGYDRGEPTVANALAAYLGPDAVFHPVNRLDRGTSGVMLVARSGYVHDRLRRVLHTGDFRRTYLAVACGTGLPPRGTIDLVILVEELKERVEVGAVLQLERCILDLPAQILHLLREAGNAVRDGPFQLMDGSAVLFELLADAAELRLDLAQVDLLDDGLLRLAAGAAAEVDAEQIAARIFEHGQHALPVSI